MIVLSKGYKLPETGDFGDVWFPALEDNINQINTHDHDGTDSERIVGQNLTATTVSVLVGAFVDQGNGYFRTTLTVPGGRGVDDYVITIRDPTTKDIMYLKTQKLSATQFYIYINQAQAVEVCYGV